MTTFTQATARSAWRISVVFSGAFAALADATVYALARADGARSVAYVKRAWATDGGNTAGELALSEALVPNVAYALTATGVTGSIALSFGVLPVQATRPERGDDPEAEAYGIDWDWTGAALGADGDVVVVRGLACLKHDLAAIAVTEPGELFHRPDEGAGMPARVNGTNEAQEIRGALARQFRRDDRVRDLSIEMVQRTDGGIEARASVLSVALDERIPVTAAART